MLSVVVRYLLDSGVVNEALLALVKVSSTTCASLCDIIVSCLNVQHFDMRFLIAQCYDSASYMFGQYNGVQARLKVTLLCNNREPLDSYCWTPS